MDMFNPQTIEQAKEIAKKMAIYAKETGNPCAFEIVRTKSKQFNIQPFGMHKLFKTHVLLHVEPIPE